MMKAVPVFYTPRMATHSGSFSPSAMKPRHVVAMWQGGPVPISIRDPLHATLPMLDAAHSPEYVRGIMDGRIKNGHGNTRHEVASTLPLTCGAMLSAALEAVANGVGAVAPVSGFHHAGFDRAGGYCTFNGLMVTAMHLSELRIGILDLDYHFGNGTADIIDRLSQGDRITHYSQGAFRKQRPGPWLKQLPDIVKGFSDCDLVLYQAGADAHIDDPLGGFLTTDQLLERDRIVFSTLRSLGVPVAWNLAGGYQEDFNKVLKIHSNTMLAFSESFFKEAQDGQHN